MTRVQEIRREAASRIHIKEVEFHHPFIPFEGPHKTAVHFAELLIAAERDRDARGKLLMDLIQENDDDNSYSGYDSIAKAPRALLAPQEVK